LNLMMLICPMIFFPVAARKHVARMRMELVNGVRVLGI